VWAPCLASLPARFSHLCEPGYSFLQSLEALELNYIERHRSGSVEIVDCGSRTISKLNDLRITRSVLGPWRLAWPLRSRMRDTIVVYELELAPVILANLLRLRLITFYAGVLLLVLKGKYMMHEVRSLV